MSIGASRHRGPSPFAMSGLKPRQTSAYMVPYYDWFLANVPVHPDPDTRCGKPYCPCAPDPQAPEAQEGCCSKCGAKTGIPIKVCSRCITGVLDPQEGDEG